MRTIIKYLLLLSLFLSFPSCDFLENDTIEEYASFVDDENAILSSRYLSLTKENSTFLSVNLVSGSFVVQFNDESIVPKQGNVFVWTDDNSASIRRITGVNKSADNSFILQTDIGALTDIFVNADFSLSSSHATKAMSTGREVFYPAQMVYEVSDSTKTTVDTRVLSTDFTFSNDLASGADGLSSLNLTGSFSSSLDLVLDFNFNGVKDAMQKVKSSEVIMNSKVVGDVGVDCELSFGAYKGTRIGNEEIILKEDVIRPVGLWFYPYGVPVFVSCTADLLYDNDLSIEGEFQVAYGASYNLTAEAGVKYDQHTNSVNSFCESKQNIKPLTPSITGVVNIEHKVSVYPRFNVRLYNIIGPSIDFKPYLKQKVSGEAHIEGEASEDRFSLVYSAYVGMDIHSCLHLPSINGYGGDVADKQFEVFEKEIYRVPNSIKVRETSDNKTAFFDVYDYNPITGREVKTTNPIPVFFNDKKTRVTKGGSVELPLKGQDNLIQAEILTPEGTEYAEYEFDHDVVIDEVAVSYQQLELVKEKISFSTLGYWHHEIMPLSIRIKAHYDGPNGDKWGIENYKGERFYSSSSTLDISYRDTVYVLSEAYQDFYIFGKSYPQCMSLYSSLNVDYENYVATATYKNKTFANNKRGKDFFYDVVYDQKPELIIRDLDVYEYELHHWDGSEHYPEINNAHYSYNFSLSVRGLFWLDWPIGYAQYYRVYEDPSFNKNNRDNHQIRFNNDRGEPYMEQDAIVIFDYVGVMVDDISSDDDDDWYVTSYIRGTYVTLYSTNHIHNQYSGPYLVN